MQYSDLLIKLLKKDTCIVIFNNIKINEDGIKSTKEQSKYIRHVKNMYQEIEK